MKKVYVIMSFLLTAFAVQTGMARSGRIKIIKVLSNVLCLLQKGKMRQAQNLIEEVVFHPDYFGDHTVDFIVICYLNCELETEIRKGTIDYECQIKTKAFIARETIHLIFRILADGSSSEKKE